MRSLFPIAVALLVLLALPGAVVFAADVLGYGPDLNARLERYLGISHRLAVSLPAAVADGDSGMLIVFNRTAQIRQGYTPARDLLRAAVMRVEPSAAQTRFDDALNLAASRANPDRSTENEAAKPDDPEPGKERNYVP